MAAAIPIFEDLDSKAPSSGRIVFTWLPYQYPIAGYPPALNMCCVAFPVKIYRFEIFTRGNSLVCARRAHNKTVVALQGATTSSRFRD